MTLSRLTIVTITKDDPAGLVRTLGSAKGLRSLGAEHIVVDGSVDAGPAERIVREVGSNITIKRHPARGIADAFNAGLSESSTEWLWFLNGGDAVHEALDPGWLVTLLAGSRADLVVGGIHYDGDDKPRPVPRLRQQWPLLECWLPHPAVLLRRSILTRAGGFDPRYAIAMDYDLWMRLFAAGATADVLSVPFARFDISGLSQHPAHRRTVCREEARVIRSHWRSLLGATLYPLPRVFRRIFWSLRHASRQGRIEQGHD